MRAWRAANPELYRGREKKRYHNKNRNAEQKARRGADAIRIRARDNSAYQRELERKAGRPRPGVCEACRGTSDRVMQWDHCHQSLQFRGWICWRCNSALGMVGDSEFRLKALIKYLRKNDATLAVAA